MKGTLISICLITLLISTLIPIHLTYATEEKLVCEVEVRNLSDEVVPGVIVAVYKKINGETEWIVNNKTNDKGLATFTLEAGVYNFEAWWGEEPSYTKVGALNNFIVKENNTRAILYSNLTRINISVRDEGGKPLSFIRVNVVYNYTTLDNRNIWRERSFITNETGFLSVNNMPTTISYIIEAMRDQMLFFNQTFKSLPKKPIFNVTITCPTYKLLVHVTDSRGLPVEGALVSLYEANGEVFTGSGITDSRGDTTVSAMFGKYIVKVSLDEVNLNETVANLSEEETKLLVRCSVLNINLSVVLRDYFGSPIPNALVKLERRNGPTYEEIASQRTDSNGVALFNKIIGGKCKISIYVADTLVKALPLYLDSSRTIMVKADKYVVIGGQAIDTGQLATAILLILLIVAFGLALTYGKIAKGFKQAVARKGKKF